MESGQQLPSKAILSLLQYAEASCLPQKEHRILCTTLALLPKKVATTATDDEEIVEELPNQILRLPHYTKLLSSYHIEHCEPCRDGCCILHTSQEVTERPAVFHCLS